MFCPFSHEEFHVGELIDIIDHKMKMLEEEHHFQRPRRRDHKDFKKYPELVKGVRYDALNSYFHHVSFAILARERLAKTGSARMYI